MCCFFLACDGAVNKCHKDSLRKRMQCRSQDAKDANCLVHQSLYLAKYGGVSVRLIETVWSIASKPDRTKRTSGNRPPFSRRTQPSRKKRPPVHDLGGGDWLCGKVFQGKFNYPRCLRLRGEQRPGDFVQNYFAVCSTWPSYSVPGIRYGFCVESTGMFSCGHSAVAKWLTLS